MAPVMMTLAATTFASAALEQDGVRGISGAVEFSAPGVLIRAKQNQSVMSPVVVRVASAERDAAGVTKYRVEYIGAIAGEHDLRDYLERNDGSVLDIPPLRVTVVSQLTPEHGTDLFSTAETPTLRPTLYRGALITLGVAWVAVPVGYFAVRAARRRKIEPAPVAVPAPTLADQLRPLVEAAMSGEMSIADRGRLELMLYLYWRGKLGVEGPQSQVIPRLRTDAEAGRLLRAVEQWLHARRDGTSRAEGEVAALLEPYRHAPAMEMAGREAAA